MGNCLSKKRKRRLQNDTKKPVDFSRPSTGLSAVNKNKEVLIHGEEHDVRELIELNTMGKVVNAYKLNSFGYNTLKVATSKFSCKNLLGQGGSADVYKGWIDISTMTASKRKVGCPVAVKRLKKEGVQGREEWLNELNFLKRFNHPNVVKLIGYCSEGDHSILVYEFMPKGSLEASLLKERNNELNWSRRVKIAVGSAKGLEYLHMYSSPVIHRDMKSSNILLDNDFSPKISDFGLAKLGPQGDKSHTSSRVLGTRGYFAPEYIATGHLTMKTDVYSFGVVLLEILSGRIAVSRTYSDTSEDLVDWGKLYLSNKQLLHKIIDKKLKGIITRTEAYKFARIIRHCLSKEANERPTMTQVVHVLEELEQDMNLKHKSVGTSSSTTKIHKQVHQLHSHAAQFRSAR